MTKKHRMEKSQDGNRKNELITNIYIKKDITELTELIYAGAKLVCEKIRIPLKLQKIKTWMGNSIGIADKKSTKTGKNDKRKKKRMKYFGTKKEKATQGKITLQLEEINQKVLTKDGRLKRYRQRVKQYRQNRTFQNKERKFYHQIGEDDTKTSDASEAEQF